MYDIPHLPKENMVNILTERSVGLPPGALPPAERPPDSSAVIRKILALKKRLESQPDELKKAVLLEMDPGDRVLTRLSRLIPSRRLREMIAPSPLAIQEHNLRTTLNDVASDLALLVRVAQEKIERHRELQEMVAGVKSGEISVDELMAEIRQTVQQEAGLTRIEALEQLMGQILQDLPPEAQALRKAQMIGRVQTVLDLTRPIVETAQNGIMLGILVYDQAAADYWMVSQVRPSVDALRQAGSDMTNGMLRSAQTTPLVQQSTLQAVDGLNIVVEAIQLGTQLDQPARNEEFFKTLNEQARIFSARLEQLTAPAQPTALPNVTQS